MVATLLLSGLVQARHGFDVIHAANPPDTFVFIGLLYKAFGKRFVYDHHDLSPEMYQARFRGRGNRAVERILTWLEQLSCRSADRIIATNDSYRRLEMERSGIPPERITVVRNGPDPDRLRPMAPDLELRPAAGTVVAFAGVMGFQDGVDYLVRAIGHLVHDLKRPDVFCLLIGGKGDAQPSLKQLTRELGLEHHIRFTGWVSDDEYVRYLSTADICVIPDPANPFTDRSTMIKLMEYMALGKPVVAFDLHEHRVTAGDAAVYVPHNSERGMAEAIARLMDDPDQRDRLGRTGRSRIEQQLAWSYSVPALLEAYEAL
jgi:glycosyltransferase involved in cell wall biosynthesis